MSHIELKAEPRLEVAQTVHLVAVSAACIGVVVGSAGVAFGQWEAFVIAAIGAGQVIRMKLPKTIAETGNLIELTGCLAYIYACVFSSLLIVSQVGVRYSFFMGVVGFAFSCALAGLLGIGMAKGSLLGKVLRGVAAASPFLAAAIVLAFAWEQPTVLWLAASLFLGIFAGFPLIWVGYCLQGKIEEWFSCRKPPRIAPARNPLSHR